MRWWTTALILLVGCGSTEAPTPPAEPEQAPVAVAPPEESGESDPESEELDEEDADPAEGDSAGGVPQSHDVIMLVVHEEPLLRSEQRIVTVISERIRMRGFDIGQRDATEEEAAFVAPQLESPEAEASLAVPSSLASASHVMVVRVAPPRERSDGQLATRGISGVLVYRHGEQAPFFRARIDDTSAWRNAEDVWSGWFLSLLRSEAST